MCPAWKIYTSWEQCSVRGNCPFSIILTKAIGCWSVSIFQRLRFGRLRWQSAAHQGNGWAGGCCWEAKPTMSVNAIIKKRPWAGATNDGYAPLLKLDKFATKEKSNTILLLLHIKKALKTHFLNQLPTMRNWGSFMNTCFSAEVMKKRFWSFPTRRFCLCSFSELLSLVWSGFGSGGKKGDITYSRALICMETWWQEHWLIKRCFQCHLAMNTSSEKKQKNIAKRNRDNVWTFRWSPR